MIDYDTARRLVQQHLEPRWRHGTFCVDDREIVETDDYYAFQVGAREFLVDGDQRYEAIGGVTVVHKADGRIGALPSAEVATNPTIRRRPNPTPIDQT